MPLRSLSRRSFLAATAALPIFSQVPLLGADGLRRPKSFSADPFSLGVASGDPLPTGVVLWTRLAPDPLDEGGLNSEPIEVNWQIADDEEMKKIVKQGTAVASPDFAHSIHVEAEGLQPDRWYFYRFMVGDAISPVGRTRTAPAKNASPERLRFAFASCQHFESGLYTAYQHMAKADLDLVVHLGDYIYEGKANPKALRQHRGGEIDSLADYRNRHALYKTDEHLQAVHAAFPWVVTWDDHEVDNNYANGTSEQFDVDAATLLQRRARAYQAYYEHMPLRRASIPRGPDLDLYRRVRFGDLADFFVLDTRQYRSDQPCGDGNKPPCDGAFDPKQTLLGAKQKQWLKKSLQDSASNWNVLAQQVMFAPVDREPGSLEKRSMDQWPGYEAERGELIRFLDEAAVNNPVVITGDIHSNWANDLRLSDANSKTVATEYVGTSISSGGNGSAREDVAASLKSENPFVKFFNGERGYVSCELTRKAWKSDYQVVEYVDKPGAPLVTRASFVTESGRPGVQQA